MHIVISGIAKICMYGVQQGHLNGGCGRSVFSPPGKGSGEGAIMLFPQKFFRYFVCENDLHVWIIQILKIG